MSLCSHTQPSAGVQWGAQGRLARVPQPHLLGLSNVLPATDDTLAATL